MVKVAVGRRPQAHSPREEFERGDPMASTASIRCLNGSYPLAQRLPSAVCLGARLTVASGTCVRWGTVHALCVGIWNPFVRGGSVTSSATVCFHTWDDGPRASSQYGGASRPPVATPLGRFRSRSPRDKMSTTRTWCQPRSPLYHSRLGPKATLLVYAHFSVRWVNALASAVASIT